MLKVNFLQFKITLKFSFADGLPPLFSIVAYLYPIIFDVAVPTVLADFSLPASKSTQCGNLATVTEYMVCQ